MSFPDISEYVEKGILSDIIRGTLDLCAKSLVEKGAFTPALVVIMDGDYTSYDVPDGRSEMATFFVDKVEEYRGKAIGYLFITETWSLSLSTDDMDEIRKYANNPDMIVHNPFKEERLAFYGASKDESYSGYVPFGREENGEIKAENLVLDEDFLGDEYFVNIADLLLPMVQ